MYHQHIFYQIHIHINCNNDRQKNKNGNDWRQVFGAFIGAVHRMAANLDGDIELVSGCFSSDPKKSKQAGKELHLSALRVYASYKDMIRLEKNLPDNEKIDISSIVTPKSFTF